MIVDWRLGGSTFGTEVIKQIRNDPRLQSLPIILTTAASVQDNKELQDFQWRSWKSLLPLKLLSSNFRPFCDATNC